MHGKMADFAIQEYSKFISRKNLNATKIMKFPHCDMLICTLPQSQFFCEI